MHSRSFHPSHTSSNRCIGIARVIHERLMVLARALSSCLFVRASALQSTECWTLTCPHPSLSVIHCSYMPHKERKGLPRISCLHGVDFFKKKGHFPQSGDENCLKMDRTKYRTMPLVPPCRQIWFCVAFYFGPTALLLVLLTHLVTAESTGLVLFLLQRPERITFST